MTLIARYRTMIVASAVALVAISGLIYWMLGSPESQRVDAAVAVKGACDKIELSGAYDAFLIVQERINGALQDEQLLFNINVSGDDYYAQIASTADSSTGELMRVAGVNYLKDAGIEEWVVVESDFADIFPACTKLGTISDLGETDIQDEVKADHYFATSTPTFLSTGREGDEEFAKHEELYEFWVSTDGQLVQHKREVISTETVNGEELRISLEHLFTFSGFGEPNAITAPIVK